MTTTFDHKDPYENPVIEFDFAGELASISGTPAITVTPINGADAGAMAILSGAFQILGTSVFQRVDGGLININYELRCEASDGVNKRVRTAILPVRRG